MLENLKIADPYDGFLFLAESIRNPPVLRPHHHVELELNLVVEGNITYVAEGRRHRFAKRSLVWFFPSQEHQLIDRSPDAAYYVAVFKPAMIRDACRSSRYRELGRKRIGKPGVLSTELVPTSFDLVRQTMNALVADGIDPDLLNREAGFGIHEEFQFSHSDPDWLNAGLRHLLLLCWRHQQGHGDARKKPQLHRAVSRALNLMADPDLPDDLDSLARQCHLSPSHLSRLFQEQVGVSLSRYRNSVRLGRFWEAYRRTGRGNLLECMFEAGFGSYAQFYRVFKEAYGVGPRDSRIT